MTVDRHHAQEENVGAYLLGALTDLELMAFERHLDECPVCRDEVERLRPASDALPRSVTPVEPPPSLKASLMEVVERDVRAMQRSRRKERVGLGERLAAALGGLRPAITLAAVALVIVAAGLTTYAVTREDAPRDSSRTLAAAVDKGRIPLATGNLVVPGKAEKGAILRVHGMPTLGAKSVYQVWLKRDGAVSSQALFDVGPDGTGSAGISEDLTGAEAILVTRERAGGARAPSEEPILSVAL